MEEARALMEAPGRHDLALQGEILKFEYSIAPQPTAGTGAGDAGRAGGAPLDWVCGMCQAVNFSRRAPRTGRGPFVWNSCYVLSWAMSLMHLQTPLNICCAPSATAGRLPQFGLPLLMSRGEHLKRCGRVWKFAARCDCKVGPPVGTHISAPAARRLECYQCSTPRPSDALRISAEPEAPSCVLKVSGLEPHIRCWPSLRLWHRSRPALPCSHAKGAGPHIQPRILCAWPLMPGLQCSVLGSKVP